METRKAVRTVVAVVAAGVLRRAEPAADLAGKGILAGVRLVVAFFKGLAFVFAVHGVSSGRKIMRNPSGGTACVGFAGPPGQATRSGDRVMCFKKFSFKSRFCKRRHCPLTIAYYSPILRVVNRSLPALQSLSVRQESRGRRRSAPRPTRRRYRRARCGPSRSW